MSVPNEEWITFLDRIAVRVDALLLQPGSLDTFQQKIQAFRERWEEHYDESNHYAQARLCHWEAVKKDAQLRDKTAVPPEKGWEWDKGGYLAGLPTEVGPMWEIPAKYVPDLMTAVETGIEHNAAEMKRYAESSHEHRRLAEAIMTFQQDLVELHREFDQVTPREQATAWVKAPRRARRTPNKVVTGFQWWQWLGITEEELLGCWRPPVTKIPEHPVERLIPLRETMRLPPPRDKAEEYERYYVSLSSIHDHHCPGSESITEGVWPDELAKQVWLRFSGAQPHGPDRAFIETALNRVRAELETGGAKDGVQEDERERTGSASMLSTRIRNEFMRAAESFPRLTYVYVEWDAQGSAPEVPTDFEFDASDPSRNTLLATPHGRGDERASLSWLSRPTGQDWQVENARDRLRQLVSVFFDCDRESKWLFSRRDVLGAKKCRLYTAEDFGKTEFFSIGRNACRRAKPGEAFFQVVEDLFQGCAIACGNQSGTVDSAPEVKARDEHNYCTVVLQMKEIGAALGMRQKAKSDDIRSLLASTGIVIRSLTRKQHQVALDTLPVAYRVRFAQYIHDIHGVEIAFDSPHSP